MIDDTTKPDAQLLDEEAERLAEILLGSPVVPRIDDADLPKTPSTDSLFPVGGVIDDDAAAIIMGDLWEPVTDEVPVVELGLDLEDDAAVGTEAVASATSSVLATADTADGPEVDNSSLFGDRIPESTKKISVDELFAEEPAKSEAPTISVGKLFGDRSDDDAAGAALTAPIFGAKVAPSQVEFVPVEEVSDRRRPAAIVAGSIFGLLLLVALIAFFTGDDADGGPTEISAVPATTIELTTTTAEQTTTVVEETTTTVQRTTAAPSTSLASTTLASTTEAPTTTVAPATAAPTTRRVVTTRRPATTRRVTTTAAPATAAPTTAAPAPTAAPTTLAPTAPPTTQAATTVVPTFSIDAGG